MRPLSYFLSALLSTLPACSDAFFLSFFSNWCIFTGDPCFPAIQCFLNAFLFSGFDGGDYENYPRWFREDSVARLAQTGEYKGPNDIEEYVKFQNALYSPYFASDDWTDDFPRFVGYENGECIWRLFAKIRYKMDPETARDDPEFDVVSMARFYWNYKESYATKIYAYSPPGVQNLFFNELLNSPNTRKFICGVLSDTCKDITDQTNADTCETDLAALPATTDPIDNVEGNSQGCRALHAVLALSSPEQHCPHVGLAPLADPKGRFKCQNTTSSLPTELLDEEDFEAFRVYAESQGFDPEIGHRIV